MVRCFLECSFWQHELDQKGRVHSQGGPVEALCRGLPTRHGAVRQWLLSPSTNERDKLQRHRTVPSQRLSLARLSLSSLHSHWLSSAPCVLCENHMDLNSRVGTDNYAHEEPYA